MKLRQAHVCQRKPTNASSSNIIGRAQGHGGANFAGEEYEAEEPGLARQTTRSAGSRDRAGATARMIRPLVTHKGSTVNGTPIDGTAWVALCCRVVFVFSRLSVTNRSSAPHGATNLPPNLAIPASHTRTSRSLARYSVDAHMGRRLTKLSRYVRLIELKFVAGAESTSPA